MPGSFDTLRDANGRIIRPHSGDLDGLSNSTKYEADLASMAAEGGTSDPRLIRLAELGQRLTKIPYCPYEPTPKQRKFLLDFSREALYGGAVGGAKSVGILMAALQFVDVPGYNALLLRKSFSDLDQPGALIPMADDWLRGKGPKWDQTSHSWTFPSGATLTFGYIERENDRLKYQGAAYHFVGFDELTQHKERDYRYLFSRMRRPKNSQLVHVPIRMRSTTNPGGPGHEWVYRRFIKPWEAWKRGKGRRPFRNFHPSFLADNPHLDAEEYLEFLAELDPITRAQLLRGDWNIRPEGRLFKDRWFVALTDNPAVYDLYPTVRYWDLAATDESPDKDPDWTVGTKMSMQPDGQVIIRDVVRFRLSPGAVERRVLNTAIRDGYGVPVYVEQDPGQAGKAQVAQYRKLLAGWEFHGNLPSGSKIIRATPFASYADDNPDAIEIIGNDYTELVGKGKARIVMADWNDVWLDELGLFPDGFHDDQVDDASGAFQVLTKRVRSMGWLVGGFAQGTIADETFIEPSAWRMDEYADGY